MKLTDPRLRDITGSFVENFLLTRNQKGRMVRLGIMEYLEPGVKEITFWVRSEVMLGDDDSLDELFRKYVQADGFLHLRYTLGNPPLSWSTYLWHLFTFKRWGKS